MKNEKAEKEAPNCRHQIHEERLGSYYTEVVLSFLQANHSLNHLLRNPHRVIFPNREVLSNIFECLVYFFGHYS